MEGKLVVLTGATSGLGRATALALGKLGAGLILVSRNIGKGNALAQQIARFGTGASAWFVQTDLASQKSVRSAADEIRQRFNCVDILINNGGARFDSYRKTEDGVERTFATNHLGHFALTGLLLDRLAVAPTPRVVTVSSRAAAQAIYDGEWQSLPPDFDCRQAYAKAKLANLLFASALAQRTKNSRIISVAYDPGIVASRFGLNNGFIPWLKHLLYHGARRELRWPATAADGLVHLAVTDQLASTASGACFRERQEVRTCAASLPPSAAKDLWSLSVTLTGIDPGSSPPNSI